MIKIHLKYIMNYFIHRITNAKAERINTKIALIKKMALNQTNMWHPKITMNFRPGNLNLALKPYAKV